jgi:membrane-associated phospholipid phosphatase
VDRRILQFVVGCSFFVVLAGSSRICSATPVPQQSGAESSAKGDATETSQQNTGSTNDSSAPVPQPDPREQDNTLGKHVFKNFAEDQKAIWTSPRHVRLVDAEWLVPLGGAAAAMFATDTEVSKHLSNSPSRISSSNSLSNYGIASLAAAAGGMYVWGHFTQNDHMRETGFLAIEAAANSFGDTYALKYALGRERPLQDNFQGHFWSGGVSFPSEHASAAWSIASVIAHEYPGPVTSVVSYGLAAAVSAARVSGKDHFPSDVLVGSALGWFIGQEVYRHHHDPTLGGGDWETYAESHERGPNRPSNSVGSPYVELDSWIYPALERLAALGYMEDAFLGLRPWTRRECLRLLEEAEDRIGATDQPNSQAEGLIGTLETEFAPETSDEGRNTRLDVNSVYARYANISGEPLTDGYHFGQTVINDYGRPYAEGNNEIVGVDAWASAGPMIGYARVEYQQAPSVPALPAAARQLIQRVDFLLPDGLFGFPVPPVAVPSTPIAAANQVDLLEGYVGFQVSNWEITYGKQSEWWGPDRGGPMMFSNNAEPVSMLRINRTSPFRLPSILGLLGPIRVEFFVGQLGGERFNFNASKGFLGSPNATLNEQPLINGQAFSFKPTENLEFGFTRTTIFGGELVPFTPHKLIQSIFSLGNGLPGASDDPGDRRSGFDLDYRLPWVRKWVSFYADGFAEDQVSPVAYWDRSAWVSGLYISHLPHLPKLDLRVEGGYSDLPIGGNVCCGFFYFNSHYLSGYTNLGNLMGSWMGRDGQAAQAWTTYWFTPRNKLQFNFRHQKVGDDFIPQGGTLTDAGVNADFLVHSRFSLSGSVQYEQWDFPILSASRKTDVTTSLQVTFWTDALWRKSSVSSMWGSH